jgi:hypothetical protein
MNRLAIKITVCTCWLGMAGIAAAQGPRVRSVAPPAKSSVETPPPAPQPYSPGEAMMSSAARAHEQHLLQSQAAAESIKRAAVARAEQRTRRLESQRWYGISNSRPTAGVDLIDGDYSAHWVSNYPFYPYRWIGGAESWGYVESQ